ncbi:OPT oligopeptide transporter protein-domain-containing protein [Cercophora newfieldiana]|uniref:OPT oligopeptide transporter protein-domain-containing protein n=1 Tax=Cercophora newfieldiana TaxID=92897 RepID=A0AA40CP32_9PEZI|nr:OPT oligopeptide transporter protein-domain-containing protein [Cercophora newfieldiana]
MVGRKFTLRAVGAGLCTGLLVNISNTYYGLRIGVASQMSMVSTLLGFIGFKVFSRYLAAPLTPSENVLLLSVSTAVGSMPVTAGFVGIIPALEYLIKAEEEGGPLRLPLDRLVLWSAGLCFFGLIFAALFHEQFIIGEKLPWPGARATAHLIRTLHRQPLDFEHEREPPLPAEPTTTGEPQAGQEDTEAFIGERGPLLGNNPATGVRWEPALQSLLRGAIASWVIGVAMYFAPILREVPVFGHNAAKEWLWQVDLSPGFFGQGIITGPVIPLHMLMGAIVGWGILSPYAKRSGWAPGSVDDWETGSRGWIIWVSLAALLADALVNLAWLTFRPLVRLFPFDRGCLPRIHRHLHPRYRLIPERDSGSEQSLRSQHSTERRRPLNGHRQVQEAPGTPSGVISLSRWMLSFFFLGSVLTCMFAVHTVFGSLIPWYYTLLAVSLSLPMAVVGIRSLAETDYNPETSLVSQLVFASLISPSHPNAIIVNLLSAGITQAGASQSGDISFDFKIGHLVGARPAPQIYGQIIGSLFGTLVSCGIYRLYASQYPIPGPLFRIPASYLVLSTARLVLGRGLPVGVAPFMIVSATLSVAVSITRIRYSERWWQPLIPTGVSFAIGMYNTPSFTITRAVGGLFCWAYKRSRNGCEDSIMVLASGLVLGESVASLTGLALLAMHAPQLGENEGIRSN